MILAGAGMCNAGRILHHLRNNVWKPETSVVIVGYQGHAVGRALVEAEGRANFRERIAVKASVHTIGRTQRACGRQTCWIGFRRWRRAGPGCSSRTEKGRARERLAACY